MFNYSHKLAKATDICDSEPPLRGFRGDSPKDMSSRGTGFRGGTFSDNFAGSKDFDPGKFSQDLNNIGSSPKAPELAATQRSPLRSPPKPLSVPPLVACEFSSELPQSHSFHFESGSAHRSPNYRMSDMASLRSALSLDYSAWDCVLEEADSLDGGSFETETDEAAAYTACEFLTSMETPSHEEFVIGDDEGRQSPVSWTSLFALQTEVFVLFLLKSVVSSLHSLHQCFSKQLVREQFVPSLAVQGTCQWEAGPNSPLHVVLGVFVMLCR
ncbi:protein mono-ADP-ribosyltransferase PARP4-like [Rattus rattus]|uniref:protein mono-ADP-ribosyltransferase PARP4-like n=1 Tax=Rattus rattus TaxID=10117 RepID=UPI0013F352EB|nr:protein mono-ADP-ribosyltransferase PARP4-like [Rattus rattus]